MSPDTHMLSGSLFSRPGVSGPQAARADNRLFPQPYLLIVSLSLFPSLSTLLFCFLSLSLFLPPSHFFSLARERDKSPPIPQPRECGTDKIVRARLQPCFSGASFQTFYVVFCWLGSGTHHRIVPSTHRRSPKKHPAVPK